MSGFFHLVHSSQQQHFDLDRNGCCYTAQVISGGYTCDAVCECLELGGFRLSMCVNLLMCHH